MLIKYDLYFYFAVPPERPNIYDTTKQAKLTTVEAYNEGSDIILACETAGGKYL